MYISFELQGSVSAFKIPSPAAPLTLRLSSVGNKAAVPADDDTLARVGSATWHDSSRHALAPSPGQCPKWYKHADRVACELSHDSRRRGWAANSNSHTPEPVRQGIRYHQNLNIGMGIEAAHSIPSLCPGLVETATSVEPRSRGAESLANFIHYTFESTAYSEG